MEFLVTFIFGQKFSMKVDKTTISPKHKYYYAICIISISTVVKIFFVYNDLRLYSLLYKKRKNTTQNSML